LELAYFLFLYWPGQPHMPSVNRRTGSAVLTILLGLGIEFSPLDPMRALFWSAVINGIVAVPVMVAMMWVGSQRGQMGRFTLSPVILVLGWAATATMAAAVFAMFAFTGLG
jgi:Mn2+/Fe2+ NRAMP family transporter